MIWSGERNPRVYLVSPAKILEIISGRHTAHRVRDDVYFRRARFRYDVVDLIADLRRCRRVRAEEAVVVRVKLVVLPAVSEESLPHCVEVCGAAEIPVHEENRIVREHRQSGAGTGRLGACQQRSKCRERQRSFQGFLHCRARIDLQ